MNHPLERACPICGAAPGEECFDGYLYVEESKLLQNRVLRAPHAERKSSQMATNHILKHCPACGAKPGDPCVWKGEIPPGMYIATGEPGPGPLRTRLRPFHPERVSDRVHVRRLSVACNQPLTPQTAEAHDTMEMIEGKLCRLQITLDLYTTPGHPISQQWLDAVSALQKLMPQEKEEG